MDNNAIGSGKTGSPNLAGPTGQPAEGVKKDYQAMHSELENRLGEQGRELGEYRTFFENIAPLLGKLDESPELVQAIVDGKIDQELARAVIDGKITIGDAETVTEAHSQVKEDLGKQKYEKTSTEDINKLVEKKISEVRKDMESKMTEEKELSAFESNVNDFVSRTPDFMQFAPEIDAWLDEHDITDIEVAYDVVKGRALAKIIEAGSAETMAEAAKLLALNASGGASTATSISSDSDLVDELIGGRSNPNVF